MNPSLSVILPVYNEAESLAPVVLRLLELLPDLTGCFEVLIVDDASTDHSLETAGELKRTYPQVRVIRHGWSWGASAAVRTGRIEARGQQVIVVRSLADFDPREIIRQWNAASGLVSSRRHGATESKPPPSRLRRTEPAHGEAGTQREPSFLKHLRQLSEV